LGISASNPLCVTALDPIKNAVIVGNKVYLFRNEFVVTCLIWISIAVLDQPLKMNVKIRSSQKDSVTIVTPLNNGEVLLKLKQAQQFVTPGQTAVFIRVTLSKGVE